MIRNILVVCTGNICRSPIGAAVLQQAVQSRGATIAVSSAGTHAVVGSPAEQQAQETARSLGADISAHIARQLTQEMAIQADLILAMAGEHREWIHSTLPFTRGRVFLFGRWKQDESVPDPYLQPLQKFTQVGRMIREHSQLWLPKLGLP